MLFFKKVREDDREVEYRFGEIPEALDRGLTFDKASRQATALDDLANAQFRTAYGKILLQLTRSGSWPEFGSHQA